MDTNAAIMDIVTVLTEAPRMEKDAALLRLMELRREGARLQKSNTKSAEDHILDLLKELGIPASLLGHRYALAMIKMIVDTGRCAPMMVMYRRVAEQFKTTPSRVERAIRHAAGTVMDRCDMDVIGELFGQTLHPTKGTLPNKEFVCQTALEVRRRMAG